MAQYVTMTDRKIATLIIMKGVEDTSKNTNDQLSDCFTAYDLARFMWISPSYADRILKELLVQGLVDCEQSLNAKNAMTNYYCINRQGTDYLEALMFLYHRAMDAVTEHKRKQVDLFTWRPKQ